MNDLIEKLAIQSGFKKYDKDDGLYSPCREGYDINDELEEFAELIVQECAEQVEQAKNSPFVSLDDAKRMKHFVDVTKKKIKKHFGVK
jgi:hypothetical protein